jgi:cytochrome c5
MRFFQLTGVSLQKIAGDIMKSSTVHLYVQAPITTVLTLHGFNAVAAEKSGREVVEQTGAACHNTGLEGAPKIGDVDSWSKHAKMGLVKLTEDAIADFGKMPAHGGQANLTDLEISRAIAYMVSSGKAVDPKKPYASPSTKSGEQLVHMHCVNCHGVGQAVAPRLSVFADWAPRLAKGIDGLVQSSIAGHKAMPARTGMTNLSDTDLRNAVTYMVIQSATYKDQP